MSSDPVGALLAVGGRDTSVRLWDVTARRPFGRPLSGHTGAVQKVIFSPTGNRLASAGDDKTIWLWDLDPNSWVARACAIARRNLTAAERQQYLGSATGERTCANVGPLNF